MCVIYILPQLFTSVSVKVVYIHLHFSEKLLIILSLKIEIIY